MKSAYCSLAQIQSLVARQKLYIVIKVLTNFLKKASAMSDSVVLEKVQKRIQELEQAIHHLDFVKRHLNQNSSQIKSQIHTSISRHLETLRNREVWLLGQVDTVLGVKEEVLHQQQARLNKTLGILHSSLAHATSSTDDDDTATKHLTHALEELSSSELKADETPYIAFRADHVALRESIMSYGRVDAKGLPLQSAFADASKPSASLPRHFEEYEDSEHHFFYKALQEAKTGCSDDSNQITVTMPKLSSRVEDWLQRPVLQLFTTESGDKGQLMTPSEANKTVDTAKHSTCSIQNWLSQIKHNPDFEEEDDFEIVDHSSQRESPVDELKLPNSLVGKSELAFKEETADFFSHIPRDLRHWLNKRVDLSPIEENLRDFFKHIPKETSLWLAKAQQQFASLDELKKGGWFRHISTDPSTWLRRAFDKKSTIVTAQQSPFVTDFFAHIPRDNSMWLINKDSSEGMEVETCEQKPEFVIKWETESYLSRVPTIADVTPAARYSQQDTMKKLTPAIESQSCQPSRTAVPGPKQHLTDINMWLASPFKETANVPELVNFFSHISCNKADWLSTGQSFGARSNSPASSDVMKIFKEDKNKWLKSTSVFTEKIFSNISSPIDSLRQAQSHLTDDDWLLGRKENLEVDKTWSLSSSRSASTASIISLGSARQTPPFDMAGWIYQKHL